MKKILIIIWLFFCLGLNAQITVLKNSYGNVISNGVSVLGLSTSIYERNMIAEYDAKLLESTDIDFIASGDDITYVNLDTVVLDGNTNVTVGNAIRFATGASGTVYTINDTLSTSDTIILDQTCTASVTDQMYVGYIASWEDQTGNLNPLLQTIDAGKMKALWVGRDSANIKSDGVNDFMTTNSNNVTVDSGSFTFYAIFKFNVSLANQYPVSSKITGTTSRINIYSSSVNDFKYYIRDDDDNVVSRDINSGDYDPDTWYYVALVVDTSAGLVYCYLNGSLDESYSLGSLGNLDVINLELSSFSIKTFASVSYFGVWKRALTLSEIIEVGQDHEIEVPVVADTYPMFLDGLLNINGRLNLTNKIQ